MTDIVAVFLADSPTPLGRPMINLLATFFVDPIPLVGWQKMLLIVPLCLAISVVYKTTRLRNLRELPVASLVLTGTIVVGMYAVGLGLWVLYSVLA